MTTRYALAHRPAALALLALCAGAPLSAQRISLPRSRAELEKIAQDNPDDAAAHYNLGLGWWSEGKYDQAQAALREALEIEPRFADAEFALAFLPFARDGELWKAVFDADRRGEGEQRILEETDLHYRRAIMIDPLVDKKIMGAVLPKKNAYLAFDGYWSRIYDDWVRGYEDFQLGRYREAYDRLSRIRENTLAQRSARSGEDLSVSAEEAGSLRKLSRDEDRLGEGILWFHGLAAAHVGEWEEAIRDIGILLERSRRTELADSVAYAPLATADYDYILGVLHEEAGRFDRAIEHFEDAFAADPSLFMAHVHLARIQEQRGDAEGALEHRRLAVSANPGDASLLLDLGITQYRTGDGPGAAASLERAIEQNPRDTRSYYLLGLVRTALGDADGARAALAKFIERAPARLAPQVEDARTRLEALSS